MGDPVGSCVVRFLSPWKNAVKIENLKKKKVQQRVLRLVQQRLAVAALAGLPAEHALLQVARALLLALLAPFLALAFAAQDCWKCEYLFLERNLGGL